MNETIVYIGRSDVHKGKLDELKAGIRHLAERLEPQLISHGFRVDEAAHRMTVVVVHTDSAWLVTIQASLGTLAGTLEPMPLCAYQAHIVLP